MSSKNSNTPAAPWPMSWLDGLTCGACCTSHDTEEKQDPVIVAFIALTEVETDDDLYIKALLEQWEKENQEVAQPASGKVPPTLLQQAGAPVEETTKRQVPSKFQGFQRSLAVEKLMKMYPNSKRVDVPGEQ